MTGQPLLLTRITLVFPGDESRACPTSSLVLSVSSPSLGCFSAAEDPFARRTCQIDKARVRSALSISLGPTLTRPAGAVNPNLLTSARPTHPAAPAFPA